MLAWNTRGLNKVAKTREVSFRLNALNVHIAALLETRVKERNAGKVRKRFGTKWCHADNYDHHDNGRIWLLWNDQRIKVQILSKSDQFIHCGIYDMADSLLQWTTFIYAQNHLDRHRELWHAIEQLALNLNGPWMVIGDLNNVLGLNDRIGGNPVTPPEFADLETMMAITNLAEKATEGDYFTWTNKQTHNTIYSRIDRALCNPSWYLKYPDLKIHVLDAGISNHSPLHVEACSLNPRHYPKQFRFMNCMATHTDFLSRVHSAWQHDYKGQPMYILWKKLQFLE